MILKSLAGTMLVFTIWVHSSAAQDKALALEAGANYSGFAGRNSHPALHPSGGFSPYLGITWHLPGSIYPISIGLRAHMFKAELDHNNSSAQTGPEEYTFSHRQTFIQLQIPVAYHWRLGHSDISAALSPALYFNTDSDFNSEFPEFSDPDIEFMSRGMTYILPRKTTANIDLSVSYTYYIAQLKDRKLGIKVHASYPMIKALSTYTTYEYTIDYKNSDKISKSTLHSDTYAPFTIGLGLILR